MKAPLIRVVTLAIASTATLLVTSCETTGNPREGGIFWSEQKAQGRLAERQNTLEHVERQTQHTEHKSAETQRKIDDLQQ
ncbi:MAG: hypothetical protein WCO57_02115 [Verrucomicrobiota bacterium]